MMGIIFLIVFDFLSLFTWIN